MLSKEELNFCTPNEDYLVHYILCSLAKSDIELGKRYREGVEFFNLCNTYEKTEVDKNKVKKYAQLFIETKTSIYRAIRSLTNHEKADLLEDDNKLDDFIKTLKLGENV